MSQVLKNETQSTEKNSKSIDSPNRILRKDALLWYSKKYPRRKLAEDQILSMYISIKEYAENDPILREYYRANRILV